MKKIKLIATIFVLTFSFFLVSCSEEKIIDNDPNSEYFNYSVLTEGGVKITGVKGDFPSNLVIPDKIQGKKVTQIKKRAFSNLDALTSLTFSSNIEYAEDEIIFNCINLKEISIPGSLVVDDLVTNDNKIEKIVYLDSVTELLPDSLGDKMINVKEVVMPLSIKNSVEGLFDKLVNLESVSLPGHLSLNDFFTETPENLKNVRYVEGSLNVCAYSLYGFNTVESITIPSTVKIIGRYAFGGTGITSMTLPSTITSIGKYAFSECDNLIAFVVPRDTAHLGIGTFFGCDKLTSVLLNQELTTLNSSTFQNCTSLNNVFINDSLIEIGEYAFKNTGIKEIDLKNVTKCGKDIFVDTSVETIRLNSKSLPVDFDINWISDDSITVIYK